MICHFLVFLNFSSSPWKAGSTWNAAAHSKHFASQSTIGLSQSDHYFLLVYNFSSCVTIISTHFQSKIVWFRRQILQSIESTPVYITSSKILVDFRVLYEMNLMPLQSELCFVMGFRICSPKIWQLGPLIILNWRSLRKQAEAGRSLWELSPTFSPK